MGLGYHWPTVEDSVVFSVTCSGAESTTLGWVGLSACPSLVDVTESAGCVPASSDCSAQLSGGADTGSGLVALWVGIAGTSVNNMY